MRVLVTGATGYVGGRLVPRLEAGHRVRVLVRDPSRLEGRPWAGQVEVVRGSLEDPTALRQALSGVEAAYYLVHAMLSEEDFPQAEERQARTFAQAARGPSGPLLFGLQTPLGERGSFQACGF